MAAKAKDPKRVGDFWTRKARQEHYPARSVYKLEEVDQKFRLLGPGGRVLDLGAAPGSWMRYAAGRVGEGGRVVGLDLAPITIRLTAAMRFLQMDVFEVSPSLFDGDGPFDAVLSDLAPATTGVKTTDQARSLALAHGAWLLAQEVLRPGGSFFVKVFEGPDVAAHFRELASAFETVRRVKPKSSRRISPEIFLLGLKYKGKGGQEPFSVVRSGK
jgi:23S rRNA (uridine2552-2'-O)-methyltransferase